MSAFVTSGRGRRTEERVELAVGRFLGAPLRVETTQGHEDFEQELADQYMLAAVENGSCGNGSCYRTTELPAIEQNDYIR